MRWVKTLLWLAPGTSDRESHFGRLDKGLDNGSDLGWQVIGMRKDWKQVFTVPK